MSSQNPKFSPPYLYTHTDTPIYIEKGTYTQTKMNTHTMAYSISTRPGMLPRGIFAKRLRGRNEVLNENMKILSHYEVFNNLI